MDYYFEKQVNCTVDEAVVKISENLKLHGFGILTQIDVQKTLKEKIGEDMRPYRILGACNPNFAKEAISKEKNIGIMLPCNIIVQENAEGKTMVAAINPDRTIKSIGNEGLNDIAKKVSEAMQSVLNAM